jgi:hypothetical protein
MQINLLHRRVHEEQLENVLVLHRGR